MIRFLQWLFNKRQQPADFKNTQWAHQGEHGYHNNDWGKR